MHYCRKAAAATLQLGHAIYDANGMMSISGSYGASGMGYALPPLRQGHNF
jgi:hypothetical protein